MATTPKTVTLRLALRKLANPPFTDHDFRWKLLTVVLLAILKAAHIDPDKTTIE